MFRGFYLPSLHSVSLCGYPKEFKKFIGAYYSCLRGSYYSGGRTNRVGRTNRGSTVCLKKRGNGERGTISQCLWFLVWRTRFYFNPIKRKCFKSDTLDMSKYIDSNPFFSRAECIFQCKKIVKLSGFVTTRKVRKCDSCRKKCVLNKKRNKSN